MLYENLLIVSRQEKECILLLRVVEKHNRELAVVCNVSHEM